MYNKVGETDDAADSDADDDEVGNNVEDTECDSESVLD